MNNLFWKLRRMATDFIKKNPSLSIIFIYNIVVILGGIILDQLVPILLNYPPYFTEVTSQYSSSLSYHMQTAWGIFCVIVIGTLFYMKILKGIDELTKLKDGEGDFERIKKLRRKCLTLPYLIYAIQILLPTIICIIFESLFLVSSRIIFVKVVIILFSFSTLIAIVSLIFSKRIFTKILLQSSCYEENNTGTKLSLRNSIFLQILPMFIVSILFTTLIGYSRLINEKGDLIYEVYKSLLINKYQEINMITEPKKILPLLENVNFKNTKILSFVMDSKKNIVSSNSHATTALKKNFITYMDYILKAYPAFVERIYDDTSETQAAVLCLERPGGKWIVGVKFKVTSNESVTFYVASFLALLLLNILILSYFSKAISEDISLVTASLNKIAEGGEVDLNKKLPVTSNDEIGDLVIAFNKIQELEKQNIEHMRNNQNMLMERERLASLGQLIGGIAHNLRSPIMSLSGSIEGLKDLIKEYDESVDDLNVTDEDHHEIAKEMLSWVRGMQPYCSYMSDLIAAVREQVVQLNASMISSFTLDELIKRIELLMKYELLKYNCTMNINIKADLNTVIHGEVNNLVQVCNNLIINSIQAYENKGGNIEFEIDKQDDFILISVRDYGRGIPKEVQARLFKEMVTTKGKNGTGLGLYMSYLNIKGRFAGKLWFESEEGKGTVFYISFPVNIYELNDTEPPDDQQ